MSETPKIERVVAPSKEMVLLAVKALYDDDQAALAELERNGVIDEEDIVKLAEHHNDFGYEFFISKRAMREADKFGAATIKTEKELEELGLGRDGQAVLALSRLKTPAE